MATSPSSTPSQTAGFLGASAPPQVAHDAAVVKRLYRHDCQFECCPPRWSEFGDVSHEQAALESKTLSDAIVHRHRFDDEAKKWTTASFTIHDPAMRALLAEALVGYQDLDMDLLGWTFSPPFMPLVHRGDRLLVLHLRLAVKKELGGMSPEERRHKLEALGALMTFLKPLLTPSVSALAETRRTASIGFEMLWQLFLPGELVMTDSSASRLSAAWCSTKRRRPAGSLRTGSSLCSMSTGTVSGAGSSRRRL